MSTATMLSPLKSVGYELPIPPRSGDWQIDPELSFLELRVRQLHRTRALEAPIVAGLVRLADAASGCAIRIRLGAAPTRRGSNRATDWLRSAGLDSLDEPLRFDSQLLLASPYGWRMCGRIRAKHIDSLLVADAHVHRVCTQPDGHDGMVVTATGAITRTRTHDLSDMLLGSRVAVRMHTYLIHD
jgi:hypothetical protein